MKEDMENSDKMMENSTVKVASPPVQMMSTRKRKAELELRGRELRMERQAGEGPCGKIKGPELRQEEGGAPPPKADEEPGCSYSSKIRRGMAEGESSTERGSPSEGGDGWRSSILGTETKQQLLLAVPQPRRKGGRLEAGGERDARSKPRRMAGVRRGRPKRRGRRIGEVEGGSSAEKNQIQIQDPGSWIPSLFCPQSGGRNRRRKRKIKKEIKGEEGV